MPQMSGFEFHQELRKKALYGTEIKTCFITAYEIYFETLRKEFPELYGGCFIRKPIKIEDLVSRINEELSQKSNILSALYIRFKILLFIFLYSFLIILVYPQ